MKFFKKATVTSNLDTPNTVIGRGVYLEAVRMTGEEPVRIDGIYKGAIEINGSLVLGDSGTITGDVNANYFLVAGEVNGNITCSTQLHLASTAKVNGDVHATTMVVDEGSQVNGRYSVGESRIMPAALTEHGEKLRLFSTDEDVYEEEAG